jgi:predicted acetyltransferase
MIGSNDTNIAELFVKKYNKYTITLSKAKTSVLDSQKSCYNKYLKLRVKPALAEYKTAKANATTST